MEDSVFQESPQTFPAPRKQNRKRFALLIVAIVIIVIFSVFITLANTNKEEPEETTTTTTESLIDIEEPETPTPTEEETIDSDDEDNTPTPKPTQDPVDKASGLDRSDLSVEIQNGSGVAGAAGKASAFLKNLGYAISSTGNADNFDYENVTIKVKSGNSKYLDLLEKDLGSEYTIGNTSSDLSASVSAGALIIIGK